MNSPWDNQNPNDLSGIPSARGKNRLFIWLIIVALIIGLFWYLSDRFPGALDDDNRLTQLVYLIALLVFVSAGFAGRRRPWKKSLQQIAVWGGIFLVLAGFYAFRSELKIIGSRILAELVPGIGVETASQSVEFRASRNGHFLVDSLVDGHPVRFLVDTGASIIVLSPTDAERLGYKLADLKFDRIMSTANGRVRGASIKIRELIVGSIIVRNVGAIVNGAELSESLLGMNFLERLDGFEFKDGRLTLHGRGL